MKRWELLIYCLVFTGIGIAGGWYAAHQSQAPSDGEPQDAHSAAAPVLSATTLKNLGVETAKAEITSFVRHRSLPSMIEPLPLSDRPVTAPFGGVVRSISVEPSQPVEAGQPLLTFVRDPIPRPKLKRTASLLQPSHEVLHGSVFALRTAQKEAKIFRSELERLKPFTVPSEPGSPPVLPRQRTIDLQNQLLRAESTFEQARLELEKHGLSEVEIDELLAGKTLPTLGEHHWKRALEANGLWPGSAETLFRSLPEDSRQEAWVIATIGELTIAGLNTTELRDWLATTPSAGASFLELGALLQEGYTVPSLRDLFQRGVFAPLVEVRAPDGLGQADVHSIHTRIGVHVASGTPLLTLVSRDRMRLRVPAIGAETELLLSALERGDIARARPLVSGSGPDLDDLRLDRVVGLDQEDHGTSGFQDGGVGFVEVTNTVRASIRSTQGQPLRTWNLRNGLKYRFEIPIDRFDQVYVLPSDAVVTEGAAQRVLIQDGSSYRAVEVEVRLRNDRFAVISAGGTTELFPGDTVVTRGAFAVHQAIANRSGSIDPHHGHSH